MTPYYSHGGVTLYHGDARELLPLVQGEVLITDPVWPNPLPMLPGADRPGELLAEICAAVPDSVKRLVIILRSDSDPRFLSNVPAAWPFFSTHWMPLIIPGYKGRTLTSANVAYSFGAPVKSREGRRVISTQGPRAQPYLNGRPKDRHPCPRALSHRRSDLTAGELLAILSEEVGEVSRCLNENSGRGRLEAELIQVIASGVLWLEAMEIIDMDRLFQFFPQDEGEI